MKAYTCLGFTVMMARRCSSYHASGCSSVAAVDKDRVTYTTCYCNTHLCNTATMTSSLGHVIVAVAVVANAIIAHAYCDETRL